MKSSTTPTKPLLKLGPRRRALRSIKEWIAEGVLPRGEPLPAEQGMAEQLSVSRPTLRAALAELEEEGLLCRASESRVRIVASTDRRPATLPAGAAAVFSDTIAVLTDHPTDEKPTATMRRPGWERFVYVGVTEGIHSAGLHGLTLNPSRLAGERAASLLAARPRGFVLLRNALQTDQGRELLASMRAANLAVVTYGGNPELKEANLVDSVGSDHRAGCYALTQWLIGRGCRRIVRFWRRGDRAAVRPSWLTARDDGYEAAMRDAEIPSLPPIECQTLGQPVTEYDDFKMNVQLTVGQLLPHLRGEQAADAIMVISDGEALAAIAACRLLGKTPNRDVTIVGYDNYWADLLERQWETTPPAATVDKRNLIVGGELIDLLLARAAGRLPPEPQHRLVTPKLVTLDIGEARPETVAVGNA